VATVNKDIRTLKRIFNLAIEPRGYLLPGQNPFAGIKQRRQSRKPVRYITAEEFGRLIGAASTLWWKALLSVAYTTAARIGELLNLTWADVDFGQNRIRVVRKEAAGNHLVGWEPKDHEGRILPVPGEVMQLLANLQAEATEGCPYVFVPAWRWKYVQKAKKTGRWQEGQALINNLNRRLTTRRKQAGVGKFTFHDLRRTCITNWARQLPVHVVQKLAGHSDIKTTQQHYLSVLEDDLTSAQRVQSEILNRVPTDQLLTNSAENSTFPGRKAKGPIA
jgi:integrase